METFKMGENDYQIDWEGRETVVQDPGRKYGPFLSQCRGIPQWLTKRAQAAVEAVVEYT